MRQVQPRDEDLSAEFRRPDLRAIGLVLVRPGRRETDTVWCEPDTDPTPLVETAGQRLAALILVCEQDVTAYLQAEWRGVSWFTEYVDGLTRDIHRRGLDGFLLAAVTSCVGARN